MHERQQNEYKHHTNNFKTIEILHILGLKRKNYLKDELKKQII